METVVVCCADQLIGIYAIRHASVAPNFLELRGISAPTMAPVCPGGLRC